MEKMCCDIKVFETEKGYTVRIDGDLESIKSHFAGCCKTAAKGCCSDDKLLYKADCCELTVVEADGKLVITYEGDKEAAKRKLRELAGKCC